ncbi:hypothetical protein CUN38_13680 [Enterococcus faecium]|nr:hypothetical protein CUN38_13680 [Enterococcus faecium]
MFKKKFKQTKCSLKNSVHLGRVRTQPTLKRFKRGLKRDYKRGGVKFPAKKNTPFSLKQVRESS